MSESDLEFLLAEYHAAAIAQSAPNSGSKQWVRWVNQAADRLREIATLIERRDPHAIHFTALLTREPDSLWAAHHILELFASRSSEAQTAALQRIEAATVGSSVTAAGEKLWLEEWRKKNGGA